MTGGYQSTCNVLLGEFLPGGAAEVVMGLLIGHRAIFHAPVNLAAHHGSYDSGAINIGDTLARLVFAPNRVNIFTQKTPQMVTCNG